jgi:hypothetical protein
LPSAGPKAVPAPDAIGNAEASSSAKGPAPEGADGSERSRRDERCAKGQALGEREHVLLDGFADAPLSVVRIRPDDQLSLRVAPGIGAAIAAKLPFRFEGLRPTGQACRVDRALWLEVETGQQRGWVNQRFAQPTAAFQSLDQLGETPLAQLTAPTLEQLSQLLYRVLKSYSGVGPSGQAEVELIGRTEQKNSAQIVLFDGNGGDDSLSGKEYLAQAVFEAARWRVQRLEQRATCWRGVRDGLCL